jgi:hypothetical protein
MKVTSFFPKLYLEYQNYRIIKAKGDKTKNIELSVKIRLIRVICVLRGSEVQRLVAWGIEKRA